MSAFGFRGGGGITPDEANSWLASGSPWYNASGNTFRVTPGQTVPGQEDEPTRPDSRAVVVSTYGKTIALSVGRRRLGANVIWSTPLTARRIGDRTVVESQPVEVDKPGFSISYGGGSDADDPPAPPAPPAAPAPCCGDNGSGAPGDYVPPPGAGAGGGGIPPGGLPPCESNYRCTGWWTIGTCPSCASICCRQVHRSCNGATATDTVTFDFCD